jgi:hypothetical protein
MSWSSVLIALLTQVVSKLLSSGVFERILAEVQAQWFAPVTGEEKRAAVLSAIKLEFGEVSSSLINLGIEVAVTKIRAAIGQ